MNDELSTKNKEIQLLIQYCQELELKLKNCKKNDNNNEVLSLLNELDDILDENIILYDYLTLYTNNNKLLSSHIYNLTQKLDEYDYQIIKYDIDIQQLNMIYDEQKKNLNLKNKELKDKEEEIKELQKLIYEKDFIINDYVNLIDHIKEFISSIQESQTYIQLFNPTKILDNLMILFHNQLCGTIYPTPPLSSKFSHHNRS